MKAAIMQPYFFPYVGYYQLGYEVEKFVFLDDVNYIKKGYINRNSIYLQNQRKEFSIPVSKVSQNKKIIEHNYIGDFSDFVRMLEQAYSKAPFYKSIMPIVTDVIYGGDLNVSRKNANSIKCVFDYLGLYRDFSFSSQLNLGDEKKGQDRILAICEKIEANQYRNAIGGRHLYDVEIFKSKGIDLKFIQSNVHEYSQGAKTIFEKNLSIIDVLMNCEKELIISLLKGYTCV